MPIPNDLTGNNAEKFAEVWRGQLGVTGGTRQKSGGTSRVLQKNFITYIEIFEQTAHDAGLRGFAQQRGIQPRRAHTGQVSPANTGNNPLTYYETHGQEAAAMVGEYINEKWNQTVTTNNNYFVQRAKNTLASQAEIRPNGFSYEITMWYDGNDIYVAFHCYENKD
ncbi:MAG: hypothetical protein JNM84_12110 [Planctomycetes bacterium]|nr:hypothetical protein [Planctomycetota bacterium]